MLLLKQQKEEWAENKSFVKTTHAQSLLFYAHSKNAYAYFFFSPQPWATSISETSAMKGYADMDKVYEQ